MTISQSEESKSALNNPLNYFSYSSANSEKPYRRRALFQDIPQDIFKVIISKIPKNDLLKFLSISKRMYSIDYLPEYVVSNIVYNYTFKSIQQNEKNISQIFKQVVQSNDYPLDLRLSGIDINNLPLEILNKANLSITLIPPLEGFIHQAGMFNSINAVACTKIKKIHGDSILTSQGLQALIEKSPKLETINISYCKDIKDLDLSRVASTKIKEIYADSSALTSQGLQALIEKSPELEVISINNCINIQDVDLSKVDSTKLITLNVLRSAITAQSLQALLEKSPLLEELDISNFQDILGINFSNMASTKIKKFSAFLSALTSLDLNIFIQKCPKLEELNITDCRNIQYIELSNVESTEIKKIQLPPNLNIVDLQVVLEKCPKLESLYIGQCRGRSLDLSKVDSTKLKNISIYSLEFTTHDLQVLLEKCPELEILNFNVSQALCFDRQKMRPTKIKTINTSDSGLSSRALEILIENCPELVELNISGCEGILKLDLSKVLFTKLKKIDASRSSINSQGVSELLVKCPELEELSIAGCKKILDNGHGLSLNEVRSTKLKKLHANSSALTTYGLQELLEKCPELVELNISGCKKFQSMESGLNHSRMKSTKIKMLSASFSTLDTRDLNTLIEKSPELEKLNIISCRVNLMYLQVVSTKIKSINASSTTLSSICLAVLLEKSPELEDLNINKCKYVQDLDLSKVKSTKITCIDAGSSALTSQDLKSLLEKCPKLMQLCIDNCKNIQVPGQWSGQGGRLYHKEIESLSEQLQKLTIR